MKSKTYSRFLTSMAIGTVVIASGCASIPGQTESGKNIAANGPTVLNARAEPTTIELNQNLKPTTSADIIADVKDFRSKVTDVRLRFIHIPLEVPMQNIGGTTWRAELTPRQLQMLAVSGKTIDYDANVIARDQQGKVAITSNPVIVAIKTPELASTATR